MTDNLPEIQSDGSTADGRLGGSIASALWSAQAGA